MDTTPLTPTPQKTIPEIVASPPEKKSGFSFGDFLDVINPLQHIPGVSTIYRKITGDEIGATARLAGGTLFGGALGLAAAGASALIDRATGKDIGEHVLSVFTSDDENTVQETAQASPSAETNTAPPAQVVLQPASLQQAANIPTLSPQALQALLQSTEKKEDPRGNAIPNDQLLAALQKANAGYQAAQAQKMGWSMPKDALINAQH